MPNAVVAAKILHDSYQKLENFRQQLESSIVTDAEIKHVIDFLQHESTILNRHISQAGSLKDKVTTEETATKNNILHLINTIAHSPSCNQALGSQQMEFSNLLKRFEQIIRKWESRVEKIDKPLL